MVMIFLVVVVIASIIGLWMWNHKLELVFFVPIFVLICGVSIGLEHSKKMISGKYVPDGWYTVHHNLILCPVKIDFWGVVAERYEQEGDRTQWIVIKGWDKTEYIFRLEQKEPLPFGTKTVLKVGKRFIPAIPPTQATVEEVPEKDQTQEKLAPTL